jgi:hypothetical protein
MNSSHHTAVDLVTTLEVEQSAEAMQHLQTALLPANWEPANYLARLLAHDLVRDARHFLAHAMPRRRALWWATLCARDCREFAAEPVLEEVINMASRFVLMPTESDRRAAERAMHANPVNSIATHLAAAVFMSHGSLAPPEGQAIPVPPSILGRLVSTVVYAAATKKNVVEYQHHLREYIALGREIAEGQHLWPQAAKSEVSYRHDWPHAVVAGEHHQSNVAGEKHIEQVGATHE